jgi:hypothetical protein
LLPADRYLFTASRELVLDAGGGVTVPRIFSLEQNYPNPFNPETRIRFTLPASVHATLKVYDILGREVGVLLDEPMPAGQHEVVFPGGGSSGAGRIGGRLSTGVYIYRLTAGGHVESRKMLLMK